MAREIGELIDAIDGRSDELSSSAFEAETLQTAPPNLVDAMRGLRVALVKAPTAIGGDELALADQLRYFSALSHANATAGWVGFNHAGAAGMAGALLNDEGLETVFGGDAPPFIAAVAAPSGHVTSVDAGMTISGRYRFASGVRHSDWIMLTALTEGDRPGVRLVVVDTADVAITGAWEVMALQGTGSHDVELSDVFVPDQLVIDPARGRQRGGPMYALSYPVYVAGENLGFTLGVCQRFLDELAIYAKKKGGPRGRLSDRHAFRYEFAKGQLQVNAARAFGLDALGQAHDACSQNNGLSASEHRAVVAMAAFCTESAVSAVSHLFHFAGAGALASSSILQRCFRDAHGSAQHGVVSNVAYDDLGESLLG